MECLHYYTAGKKVKVQTDHKPLESIWKKSIATSSPHLQKLLLKLSEQDIEVEHLKAKENVTADTLSRVKPMLQDILNNLDIPVHQITTHFPCDATALQEFKEATRKDEVSMALTHAITNGWLKGRKQCSPVLYDYWNY